MRVARVWLLLGAVVSTVVVGCSSGDAREASVAATPTADVAPGMAGTPLALAEGEPRKRRAPATKRNAPGEGATAARASVPVEDGPDTGDPPARTGGVEGHLHGSAETWAGWRVHVRPETADRSDQGRTRSIAVEASEGTFTLADVPSGRVAVEAHHPVVGWGRSVATEVRAGETTYVDLRYDGPDPSRCIAVWHPPEEGEAPALVYAVAAGRRVDAVVRDAAQGHYLLMGLANREYELFLEPEGSGALLQDRAWPGQSVSSLRALRGLIECDF